MELGGVRITYHLFVFGIEERLRQAAPDTAPGGGGGRSADGRLSRISADYLLELTGTIAERVLHGKNMGR